MKRKFFVLAFVASLSLAACNETGSDSTTTDSTTSTTAGADMAPDASANSTGSTSASTGTNTSKNSFDESASYVNLKTNKPVRLKRNEGSEYLVDYETNEPFSYFFYNPATNDTFDRSGNIVNTYLIRSNDGAYSLDENRWRTKVDSDGDIKIKDGDDTKIKYDASSGKTKIKTGDTTIKSDN